MALPGFKSTVASLAVPFVVSASIGFEGSHASWHAKQSYRANLRTSDNTEVSDVLRLAKASSQPVSAETSESIDLTATTTVNVDAAATKHSEDQSSDWLAERLVDLWNVVRLPPSALPSETPIQQKSVAGAVQVLLDISNTIAPAPQIMARGDGGLQLVWYTPERDLEIELGPTGSPQVIEFDGTSTLRYGYAPETAAAALERIGDALKA